MKAKRFKNTPVCTLSCMVMFSSIDLFINAQEIAQETTDIQDKVLATRSR